MINLLKDQHKFIFHWTTVNKRIYLQNKSKTKRPYKEICNSQKKKTDVLKLRKSKITVRRSVLQSVWVRVWFDDREIVSL